MDADRVSTNFPSLMPVFSSFLTQASMPSQQLSNESFSLGWLAGGVVSRHRSSTSDAYDFDFDFDFGPVPRPLSPVLVHADQIFSNGFLLPLHVVSKSESSSESSSSAAGSSSSALSRSLSLDSSESYLSFSNRYSQLQQHSSNAKTGRPPASSTGKDKLPNFLAKKYLCSLLPAWSKKACRRLLGWSKATTERTPSARHLCRGGNSRPIVDDSYETAIDDAILHCKKSVGTSKVQHNI